MGNRLKTPCVTNNPKMDDDEQLEWNMFGKRNILRMFFIIKRTEKRETRYI